MRPALLRLLKRPSALSVLDSLICAPAGIEQLESRYRSECVRRYSQSAQQAKCTQDISLEQSINKQRPTQTRPPPSFRVHAIQPLAKGKRHDDICTRTSLPSSHSVLGSRALGLQLDKLEFESDIGHTDDFGSRLVDNPDNHFDFALWEELLRYRQRHYGEKGTLDIWEGMMRRLDGITLPVSGERADFFWQSFVDLGLKQPPIMKELVDEAVLLACDTGKRWDGLYESVVGGFLKRGMNQRALEYHRRLQEARMFDYNDILQVFKVAVIPSPISGADSTKSQSQVLSNNLSTFRKICRSTPGLRIYGDVISILLENGHMKEVFAMHEFLIARDDHPQSFKDLQPLLEYVEKCYPPSRIRKLRRYADERFPGETDKLNEFSVAQSQSSRPSKKQTWLREKPFKDEFGARLFATKALDFHMILSGLQMFGVTAIGPQSLHEIAIRAHGGQDILDKLQRLENAGISIGDSVFARLLRRLAAEKRNILLSDLLQSDQHPDMLEDAQAQESLLVSYYISRDWRLYNMTSAILTEICEDEPDLSNIHFRKFLAAREWGSASKTVDDLVLRGRTLTSHSIEYMVKQVLTPRRVSFRPPQGSYMSAIEEVKFVLRILQRVVPMGTPVSPVLWTELLKRLGMMGYWDELRNCCHWLARHYAFQSTRPDVFIGSKRATTGATTISRRLDHGLLQTIFSRQMQAGIVAWGFRARLPLKPQDGPVPWVRGFLLLRELEQNGVVLQESAIRQGCRLRLAVLYGKPWVSKRRMNRLLRRENRYSLERVVEDINGAWGARLFGDRECKYLQEVVNSPSWWTGPRRTARGLLRAGYEREKLGVEGDAYVE